MSFIAPIAAVFLLVPLTAAAQPWWEPYQRGEYEKAASILHSMWTKQQGDPRALHFDYDVPEMLGRIYLEGRGVQPDPVLACSFYELAASSVGMRPFGDPDPEKERITRARDGACDRLSLDERQEAIESPGCPKFGTDFQTYVVDSIRLLRVNRRLIRLDDLQHEHSAPLALPCDSRLVMGRVTHSGPNEVRSVKQQVFFELFFWTRGTTEGERELHCRRYEVMDHKVEGRDSAVLGHQPGSPWMAGDSPIEWISGSGACRGAG